MKLILPLLLLTLLVSCNSKTNVIRVDDSRTGSSGGSWDSGSGSGSDSGSDTSTDVPGVSITKGCVASGYKRTTTSSEAPYITTTGIVNAKQYNSNSTAILWSTSNLSTAIKNRLVTDGVLRMRVVALSAPARYSKDQFGNSCNEDPTASMNSYTKMQLLYRIKDGNGNVYSDGYFTPATVENGTSDCSDVVTINPSGSLLNSSSKPFSIEIIGALSNLFCIRNNKGSDYGCSSLTAINSAISSSTTFFPCVQFTLQIETDNTLVIPPKE